MIRGKHETVWNERGISGALLGVLNAKAWNAAAGPTDAFSVHRRFCDLPAWFSFGSRFYISVRDVRKVDSTRMKRGVKNRARSDPFYDRARRWKRRRIDTRLITNSIVILDEVKAVDSISLSICCRSDMHKHYTGMDEGSWQYLHAPAKYSIATNIKNTIEREKGGEWERESERKISLSGPSWNIVQVKKNPRRRIYLIFPPILTWIPYTLFDVYVISAVPSTVSTPSRHSFVRYVFSCDISDDQPDNIQTHSSLSPTGRLLFHAGKDSRNDGKEVDRRSNTGDFSSGNGQRLRSYYDAFLPRHNFFLSLGLIQASRDVLSRFSAGSTFSSRDILWNIKKISRERENRFRANIEANVSSIRGIETASVVCTRPLENA